MTLEKYLYGAAALGAAYVASNGIIATKYAMQISNIVEQGKHNDNPKTHYYTKYKLREIQRKIKQKQNNIILKNLFAPAYTSTLKRIKSTIIHLNK